MWRIGDASGVNEVIILSRIHLYNQLDNVFNIRYDVAAMRASAYTLSVNGWQYFRISQESGACNP